MKKLLLILMLIFTSAHLFSENTQRIRVLIVDGYSNHDWEYTTLVIKSLLLHTGFCSVDVATAPLNDSENYDKWRPDFSKYDVIVQNCNSLGNGNYWPEKVRMDFENYMRRWGRNDRFSFRK